MNSLINSNHFTEAGINYGNTDSDDAITLALDTVLDGTYPYTHRTWAGGPISQMPGALLLALPFYIMGNAAGQVVFWFLMLFFAAQYLMRDARAALWFWLLALVFSPKILEGQMCQGSDYMVNATYVALSSLLLIEASRRDSRRLLRVLCAILFGITMSSRMNFLLLLPLVFSGLIRISGWREAILLIFCAFCSYAAITGPFYFYDPQAFSPFHIVSMVSDASPLISFLNALTLLLAGGIAVLLAIRSDNGNLLILMRNGFLLQLWLVTWQLLFSIISGDSLERIWVMAQYGFFFFPFGFLYFGTSLHNVLKERIIHSDGTPVTLAENHAYPNRNKSGS